MKVKLTRQEKEILIRLLKQLVEEEGREEQEQPVDPNAILEELRNIGNQVTVQVTGAEINVMGGNSVLQITYNHNLFDLIDGIVNRIGEDTWRRLGAENPDVVEGILRGLFLRVIIEVVRQFNVDWIDRLVDEKIIDFMNSEFGV